jgi:hypothetical protein
MPSHLSFAAFLFGLFLTISSFINGGTEAFSFTSSDIQIMAFLSGRTASFRFGLLPWHFVKKSRTVKFGSAAQMLDFFRLPKDGRYYRRISLGFQRIFASTIFFGTEDQPNGNRLIDWARFHFFDQLHLWFTDVTTDHSNTITLSEAFYGEIDRHRVPMEREVVVALANSPGVLDFYVWIAWKSWVLKGGEVSVPLFSTGGLSDQIGCRIHPEDRFLRRKINHWLRVIRAHWPHCPARISEDGQNLIIGSSRSSPALHSAPKPVNS